MDQRKPFKFGADNNQRKYYRRESDEPLRIMAAHEEQLTAHANRLYVCEELASELKAQILLNTAVTKQTKDGLDRIEGQLSELITVVIRARAFARFVRAFWKFLGWCRVNIQKVLTFVIAAGTALTLWKGGSILEALKALIK